MSARHAKVASLKYNEDPSELIGGRHDYQISVGGKVVDLSIQLYLNVNNHYRLFLYSRCGKATGMLFSINLTTSEDVKGVIWLGQKIQFREGRGKDAAVAKQIRLAKQRIFADLLVRCGIVVTDNFEIELGTFDARRKEFLDTSPDKLVRTFITVGLVKGHFAGNKGHQFSCLPRFDDSFEWQWNKRNKRGHS